MTSPRDMARHRTSDVTYESDGDASKNRTTISKDLLQSASVKKGSYSYFLQGCTLIFDGVKFSSL